MCSHDSDSSSHSCQCGGGGHHHAATKKRAHASGRAGGVPLTVLPAEETGCCGGHGHGDHEGGGCGCGGHQHDPHADVEHACRCGSCPRRYHSLAGLVLGAYLLVHLGISFLGFWPARYQAILSFIHRHSAALLVAEVVFILLPLVVHVGYGLRFLWREGITLPKEKHHYGNATRFFWQRVSAIILFAFILFHVATLHRYGFHAVYQLTHWSALERYAPGGLFDPANAYASTVRGVHTFWNEQQPWHPGNVLVMGFYLVSVLAAVYHLANGVATSAMVWHVTEDDSPAADRLWKFCIAGGILITLIGVGAWAAFTIAASP